MRLNPPIDLTDIDIAGQALPMKGERMVRDTLAEGLALRLRASGARTWIHFVRDGSNHRKVTLGDALTIPVATVRLLVTSALAGNLPPEPERPAPLYPTTILVRDLLPHFLASGTSARWKPRTLAMMRAVSHKHITPALGDVMVSALTPEEVRRWHLDVAAKSTAVRMALSTLSGLMLYAEDHGLRPVGTNPCRNLRKRQRGQRGQFLPKATVRKLWLALEKLQAQHPDGCDVVRLLLLTGARCGEILSLEWDRIIGNRAVLEDSKEGPRTIWLGAAARAIMERRKAASQSRYVFPAPKADGHRTVIQWSWQAIRTKGALGQLRLHDLRHHFASVAVSNGIDLRVVSQLLGHHDITSTLVYAHLADSTLRRSATRVSGKIDHAMRGQCNAGTAVHA